MKNLSVVIAFVILFSNVVKAEVIVCEADGPGEIKKVIVTRNPHNYEPQWFDTVVKKKGLFSKDQSYSLSPLYFKGNKFMLMEFEGTPKKNKFSITIENANELHKQVQKVEVLSDKGSASEKKQTMTCYSDQPVEFVDYCSKSKYGEPNEALLYASKTRNANLVDMILSCGPEVNTTDTNGCSSLMYAVDHLCGTGKTDTFRNFAGNGRIIDALISAGSFVDIADPSTQETPLIKSAQDSDVYATKALADMEADVNAQDKSGFTALMYAASRGDVKLVELLVGYSPDLEVKNNQGKTAAMIAKEKGYDQVELLLQTPDKTLTFAGDSKGGCSLNENIINANKVALIELKASKEKMFLLEIPEIGVNLMADPGQAKSLRIRPTKAGVYEYSCGYHGGTSSKGRITVR